MFKNSNNPNMETVSYGELQEILTDFRHQVVGSVKQATLEVLKAGKTHIQATGKKRASPLSDSDSEDENTQEIDMNTIYDSQDEYE